MTLKEKRYGQTPMFPNGVKQDPTRCIKEVWVGFQTHQCRFKKKYGDYCGKHKKLEVFNNTLQRR